MQQEAIKGTFFYPALGRMKKQGMVPEPGTFLHHVITKDLQCWLTPWRQYTAVWTSILGLLLICGGMLYTILTRESGAGPVIIAGAAILFCVSWPLFMNNDDPVEILTQTAELLKLTPFELMEYTEKSLKYRARRVLYDIATEHIARQKVFLVGDPEFQETYRQYGTAHRHFQKMRLIPPDCSWTPYFHKTASIDF